MAGISKVILIGNLGRDPETRYTPSGAMNVQFTMAVSRRFRDSAGQDQTASSRTGGAAGSAGTSRGTRAPAAGRKGAGP